MRVLLFFLLFTAVGAAAGLFLWGWLNVISEGPR